jgi:hypothetical protein
MEVLAFFAIFCLAVGMACLAFWIHFKYWWGGELTPTVKVDRDKVYGLTGTRRVMRISAGIGFVIAAIVCFLTGNVLPGLAFALVGAFNFITASFLN